MEHAEKVSHDGEQKQKLVIEAYKDLVDARAASQDDRLKALPVIPIATIITIIEAFVYATKTAIAINKETNLFTKIKEWFKNLF